MKIINATILAYNHTSDFLGDGAFHYRTTKNISVQGALFDFTNANGLSDRIWSEADLMARFKDFENDIEINGVIFGKGTLASISFESSTDVNAKDYSAEFIVYEEGDLGNVSGPYYSGIDTSNFHWINDISEELSLEKSAGRTQYEHRVSIQCVDGTGEDPLLLAKSIALNLANQKQIELLLGPHGRGGRKTYQESVNKIDQTYSFAEIMDIAEDNGEYSVERNHSIQTNEEGITEVRESSVLTSLLEDRFGPLEGVLQGEIYSAKSRCESLFVAHTSNFYPLNEDPISLSKNVNPLEGVISYEITFSNDQRLKVSGVFIEHTRTIEEDGGYYSVSESGVVRGRGKHYIEQFEAAKSHFNAQFKEGVKNRVDALYAQRSFLPLNLVRSRVLTSEFRGEINYSYDYSSSPSSQGGEDVSSYEVSVNDSMPVNLINEFDIVNYKTVAQKTEINTLGSRGLSISLKGRRKSNLSKYVEFARNQVNRYIPSGDDVHISDAKLSYNPRERELSASVTWTYVINDQLTNLVRWQQ